MTKVARTVALLLCYFVSLACYSQAIEGTSYYLPKTAMKFTLTVEKTQYEPGQFAGYAQRYMKQDDVQLEASTTYRIVDTRMHNIAMPDTAKHFTLSLDKRYTISTVERTDNGQLLAINAEPKRVTEPAPFVPARKPRALNPRDFMNEDMLTAGSTAKMAQLIAQEIYDIRDSRNALVRGEADNTPKDGEQLRLMINQLDTQATALEQLFSGHSESSTEVYSFSCIPTQETEKDILFRFSQIAGVVDKDDLSGQPIYISIKNTGNLPARQDNPETDKKKAKMTQGIYYNMPARMAISIFDVNQELAKVECDMGQFGYTEILSNILFDKKTTTKVTFYQDNGGIKKLEQ